MALTFRFAQETDTLLILCLTAPIKCGIPVGCSPWGRRARQH